MSVGGDKVGICVVCEPATEPFQVGVGIGKVEDLHSIRREVVHVDASNVPVPVRDGVVGRYKVGVCFIGEAANKPFEVDVGVGEVEVRHTGRREVGQGDASNVPVVANAVVERYKIGKVAVGESAMKPFEVGVGIGKVEVRHTVRREVVQVDASNVPVVGGGVVDDVSVRYKVGVFTVGEPATKSFEIGVGVGEVEVRYTGR